MTEIEQLKSEIRSLKGTLGGLKGTAMKEIYREEAYKDLKAELEGAYNSLGEAYTELERLDKDEEEINDSFFCKEGYCLCPHWHNADRLQNEIKQLAKPQKNDIID